MIKPSIRIIALSFISASMMISSIAALQLRTFSSSSFAGVARRSLPRIVETASSTTMANRKKESFGTSTSIFSRAISSTALKMSIADTNLGSTEEGSALLEGLDVYTVPASGDEHPLTIYGIDSTTPKQLSEANASSNLRPILLLHGRTWSSVPVYHLHLGTSDHESRSLMESLLESGLQPYAMDFRGFGGTPSDHTGCVEPNRCVEDVETALQWIAKRHGLDSTHADDTYGLLHAEMPVLLGWSQGALVAQLVAQKSPELISKLTLYGSIYDPLIRYPRAPLFQSANSASGTEIIENCLDSAMEDFTVEGTIPPEAALCFGEAALIADPIKAIWTHLYQFNNLEPARVHVPTLVVAGDQDPYAPMRVQAELFTNLGDGADRTWSILADADHAVHLLDGRERFTKILTNFVMNGIGRRSK
mmetsp:Transcript_24545/g.34626  ORF Transcript_24545/g.34626 Transcript_24545/m.34626 type:complete len:420 (+) Transcript_24545:172-1431(+)